MKIIHRLLTIMLVGGCGIAWAALEPGVIAPDFTADAALDGKPYRFSLADALGEGPVVLYFYPKAFTAGCTVEAHLFAEAMPEFSELGAQVVGLSGDDLETLQRFSVEACRSAFPVAADPGLKIAETFAARMSERPEYASRTSFVIAPDGRILSTLTQSKPQPHISNALEVLREWNAAQVD